MAAIADSGWLAILTLAKIYAVNILDGVLQLLTQYRAAGKMRAQ